MPATISATTPCRRTPPLREALTAAFFALAITTCRRDPTTPAPQAPQPPATFARRAGSAVPPIVSDPTRVPGTYALVERPPRARLSDASTDR